MSQTLSLHRSRQLLKEQGYLTWIVEKPYNIYTHKREDLYHLFDVVAIRRDVIGVTGIQACGEDTGEHVRKILEGYVDRQGKRIPPNPYLAPWLWARNRAFIWAWRLRGRQGKRKLWDLQEIEFLLENGQVVHRLTTKKEIENENEKNLDARRKGTCC